MTSISRKSSNKVPILIFQSYLLGDEPIIIEHFFYGFEGVFMGSIMGSQNIMGSDYGSNLSANLFKDLISQNHNFQHSLATRVGNVYRRCPSETSKSPSEM